MNYEEVRDSLREGKVPRSASTLTLITVIDNAVEEQDAVVLDRILAMKPGWASTTRLEKTIKEALWVAMRVIFLRSTVEVRSSALRAVLRTGRLDLLQLFVTGGAQSRGLLAHASTPAQQRLLLQSGDRPTCEDITQILTVTYFNETYLRRDVSVAELLPHLTEIPTSKQLQDWLDGAAAHGDVPGYQALRQMIEKGSNVGPRSSHLTDAVQHSYRPMVRYLLMATPVAVRPSAWKRAQERGRGPILRALLDHRGWEAPASISVSGSDLYAFLNGRHADRLSVKVVSYIGGIQTVLGTALPTNMVRYVREAL